MTIGANSGRRSWEVGGRGRLTTLISRECHELCGHNCCSAPTGRSMLICCQSPAFACWGRGDETAPQYSVAHRKF